MPWWGWLIVSVAGVVGVYWIITGIMAAKVISTARKHIDLVHTQITSPTGDPFDAPFFKQPFDGQPLAHAKKRWR